MMCWGAFRGALLVAGCLSLQLGSTHEVKTPPAQGSAGKPASKPAQHPFTTPAPVAQPPAPVPYWDIFQQVAGARAIERAAQCRQESGFNPLARSWVGAYGLMQAMSGTWTWYQDLGWVPRDATPADPYQSIVGGHRHQSYLEARTREWTGALAAYNWGRLDRIRKAQLQAELMGFPAKDWQKFLKIPDETRGYVLRIPTVHVPWVKARLAAAPKP